MNMARTVFAADVVTSLRTLSGEEPAHAVYSLVSDDVDQLTPLTNAELDRAQRLIAARCSRTAAEHGAARFAFVRAGTRLRRRVFG
jgi:hypothetical protein